MKMEECRVGMEVIFGRGNGEQTRGVIVKINRAKAKVRTLENRGVRSQAGTEWGVPYSLMRPANSGVAFLDELNSRPPLNIEPKDFAKQADPADAPIPHHPFQNAVEVKILEAINIVYNHLSPENLTCDGEASMAFVNQKRTKLNRQLRGLFVALGREVSEKAVFDWHMEYQKQFFNN
jgi:hypothetical protein